MELTVSYRNLSERVKLGDGVEVKVLTGNPALTKPDLKLTIDLLKKEVEEFLETTKSFLIIVNDYTRPTPTAELLTHLREVIERRDPYFLVALGSHRLPTEEEYRRIFGRFYETAKEKIVPHEAKEKKRLKFLGKTSFGTPVEFNELIFYFPKIIVLNSVEPHYFAGFTGGRKTFIPGIAGYETITLNHKLSLSPMARTLFLEMNPVSSDMEEASAMVPKPIFSIQLVVDQKKEWQAIKFGRLKESFLAGVGEAKKIFCLPIDKLYDAVLAVVQPPYDVDFYQAQKALENAKLGVREGGVIILVSVCEKGVGDDEFVRVMRRGKSPAEVISLIEKEFVLGAHKSAKLAELLKKVEILAVAPISEDVLNSLFMKKMGTVQEAIDYCHRRFGKEFSLLFLPDASLVTPFFSGGS